MRSLIFILFIAFSFAGYANDDIPKSARKAEDLFIEHDYFEALDAFKVALKKDANNTFILRRIADCYRLMNIPTEAKDWYLQAIDMGGRDALDYYYCSQVHRSLGEYERANYWLEQYASLVPDDTRARRALRDKEYTKDLLTDEGAFFVEPFEVNDGRAILPPTTSNELLILPIASDINEGWFPHKRFLQDYDLYQTTVDEKFNLVSAEPLRGEVNTKFLEGPSVYDKEREVLYVTRFLSKKGKPGIDELGHVYSMIQAYRLVEGYWLEVDAFPHNSELNSCAYPTISPDGDRLIFSSNRQGGMGGMDLYQCVWQDDIEQWGEPKPLSNDINTEGTEIYPGFAPDGTFTFASDGHPTLGGLDVFFTDLDADPSVIENPGIPVNSPNDDFGLVHMGNEFGYFCSDRNTEIGGDDLFWWEQMAEVIEATIVLMDNEGNPLYPDRISIKNLRTEKEVFKSGMRGSFQAALNGKDPYEIAWNQDGKVMLMHCQPELTPYGLRYTYDSPNKHAFVADAEVDSYKEASFRKKRVPFKNWYAKNLTNTEEYPVAQNNQPTQYLLSSWNPTDVNRPPTNSRIFLKDMETGKVQSITATETGAEFELIPEHMHALTWTSHDDKSITRYIKGSMDESDEMSISFTGIPEEWQMALNDSPVMDYNKEDDQVLMAALMASTEGGVVTTEDAGELLLYAEDGRNISVEGNNTRIHAEDIYFGFDKSSISDQEASKLASIIDQLNRFPEANLEIIAHTDSRGSRKYNEWLSKRRAEKTRDKLIEQGVDPERINITWKGEEATINHCVDGVACSQGEHRINRRSEIHIILPDVRLTPGK